MNGYVYLLTGKVVNNKERITGFMNLGIYTDYKVCEKEMLTRFDAMKKRDDADFYGIADELIGAEIGIGKSAYVLWKDGSKTIYTIEPFILDQVTFVACDKES